MKSNCLLINSAVNNCVTITLNKPELHNAFDANFIKELTIELEKIDRDPAIRVGILAANGKSFCAGADLNWMREMANYTYEENIKDAQVLAHLMQTLNNLSKPTIALVQGPAYGGGVGLIACCDIAIASHKADFCFSEVKLGLIPAVISPYVIRAIGERAARRYFLTAEKFSAEEALQLGLLHMLVDSEELIATGEKIAKLIIENRPAAITAAKQLINKVANKPLDKQLIQDTVKAIAEIRVSAEGQESLKQFLERTRK